MLCRCQNCDWTGPESAAEPVHDIWSRVAPGEPMPAGDCPVCGALVQPVDGADPDEQARTITAYVLDPATQIMRPVKLDARDPGRDVNRHLGCIFTERVPVDHGHAIYIDDNGMNNSLSGFTILDGWPNPLAGRLVVVGIDENGRRVTPSLSMSEIAEKLTVVRPALDPLFETFTARSESVFVAGTRVGNFAVRLITSKPEVAS